MEMDVLVVGSQAYTECGTYSACMLHVPMDIKSELYITTCIIGQLS